MTSSELELTGRETSADEFQGTAYRCLRRLEAGGRGDVFLVRHKKTSRELVAKLIHDDLMKDPRRAQRLRIEAQSLGLLDHPNIVKITGFERTHTNRPFIVMESLRGRTLGDELRAEGKLSVGGGGFRRGSLVGARGRARTRRRSS
jgi:serine/threonine protein kinase